MSARHLMSAAAWEAEGRDDFAAGRGPANRYEVGTRAASAWRRGYRAASAARTAALLAYFDRLMALQVTARAVAP